jgi:aspartate ammonia-lyase
MTLGQEFGGFAANIAHAAKEVERSARQLLELNLGSTALGTGLNAGNDFTASAVANLAAYTGVRVRPAVSRFRVTQSMGDVLGYSGALRRLAAEVGKVASDLRLLAMGPRAGIAEITLPAVQPGSSIMPGKVNPSVPEMVNQVCFQVFGCDATILAATEAGQLELNVMMPVIAWNAIHATRILRQAMLVLRDRSVTGIEADEERCRELLERSTALATALSPYIGYEATAAIAKTAVQTGKSIRALVRERRLLPDDKLERILSAEAMTSPGVPGSKDDDATTTRAAGARGADDRTARRRAATQPAVSPRAAGLAGRPGSRRVAAARSDHGQAAHRGGKRRR